MAARMAALCGVREDRGMLSVQNNLLALNANRQLGLTGKKVGKVAEKLSSGYRINRSADDAAGLAISEKMRRQIRGLTQASTNAQDGISMVQSAEGAMNELHDMLQRANELAVKAATGTLTDEDRGMVDLEVQQLKTEIDSMAQRTVFNKIRLFPDNGLSPATASRMDGTYRYTLDYDRMSGIFKVGSDNSGVAALAGGGSAQSVLADKIANELLPNAVKQIFDAFPSLKAATGSDVIKMELEIKYDDGPGNRLAYAAVSFYQTGKPAKMSLTVDTADFTDADALGTGANATVLESTLAHELMHSVMQWNLTDGMTGRNNKERFPDWFVEGTAQLAGGGFPTNWNNWLKNDTSSLTSETDTSQDKKIAADLKKYSVDGRPYGHGYLAAAYAGYLANGGGAVTAAGIAAGMDRIFDDLLNGKSFASAIKDNTGKTETQLKVMFSNGDPALVDFVRRLSYNTNSAGNGAGSVIAAGGLATGGTDILGNSAPVQAFQIGSTSVGGSTGGGGIGGGGGGDNEVILQVGTEAGHEIKFNLYRMNTQALGMQNSNTKTVEAAQDMLYEVQMAITYVSDVRTYYGAIQNRLEHTINNLDNVVENTMAAESAIRDTDMAEAMVEYSNHQILQQAGQAMLSQANHSSDMVLGLLNS